MSLKKTLGTAIGALSLCIALTACGGSSAPSETDLSELRDEFVGTWELVSMESDATTLGEDEVDSMADAGMLVTLDLDEDGNLIFNEVGNQQDGSWSVTDEATLSFELGGSKIEVPYDDDLLTLEASGTTMLFEKASDDPNMDREPSDNVGEVAEEVVDDPVDIDDLDDGDPDVDDFAYLFTDDMIFMERMLAAAATQTAPLDITVADDDVALVKVTGIAEDPDTDTGYLVHVENRTDTDFVLVNVTTTLDGVDVYDYATLLCTVRAGESADGFFYFDHEVAVVSESSSVEVMFAALDINHNPLGIYSTTI